MSDNGVKTWKAREAWGAVKSAAASHGDLTSGLAHVALSAWGERDAGEKISSDRAHREAFVASLAGAAAVDEVIQKLAEEGTISTPEAEYMLDLNAESALRDLGQFQKTANVFRTVAQFIVKNPTAVGALAGAVAGGAFGAYGDDENRLRGALRFGLPGAVMGGMIGHGVGQLRAEELRQIREEEEKVLKATREAEMHAAKLKQLKERARG